MKYCAKCGNELMDEAVVCVKCGCPVNSAPVVMGQTPAPVPTTEKAEPSKAPVVLGVLGIVCAWLFALAGHILSIIGIVMGIKEYKKTGNMTGLVLSIIGEVCAIFSSIIGAATMAAL